ncbi:MAG TPA: hypothetical protein VNG13_07875 [Mycobacteriales bacterium]|nr:hypothetical protein [Mycobacteriales bacterium]
MTRNRYCPACRDEREFEQPPCLDGHSDCPEWSCVECGHAVFVGWFADQAPARRSAAA